MKFVEWERAIKTSQEKERKAVQNRTTENQNGATDAHDQQEYSHDQSLFSRFSMPPKNLIFSINVYPPLKLTVP